MIISPVLQAARPSAARRRPDEERHAPWSPAPDTVLNTALTQPPWPPEGTGRRRLAMRRLYRRHERTPITRERP